MKILCREHLTDRCDVSSANGAACQCKTPGFLDAWSACMETTCPDHANEATGLLSRACARCGKCGAQLGVVALPSCSCGATALTSDPDDGDLVLAGSNGSLIVDSDGDVVVSSSGSSSVSAGGGISVTGGSTGNGGGNTGPGGDKAAGSATVLSAGWTTVIFVTLATIIYHS